MNIKGIQVEGEVIKNLSYLLVIQTMFVFDFLKTKTNKG